MILTSCEPWLCPHGSIVGGGGAPKLEKLTLSGSLNIHRGRLVTPVQASFYFIARFGHNALKRLLGTVRALLPGLYDRFKCVSLIDISVTDNKSLRIRWANIDS